MRLFLIPAAVVLLALTGCQLHPVGSGSVSSSQSSDEREEEAYKPPTSAPEPEEIWDVTITFESDQELGKILAYDLGFSEEEMVVEMPWVHHFVVTGREPSFLVYGSNYDHYGTLTCTVEVNGEIWDEDEARGLGREISCSN